MGESLGDRIDLVITLRELDVDSFPVNILIQRPGTPLFGSQPLKPVDIVLTIAVFTFLLPEKEIKICPGKEIQLRQLRPLAIIAGCNSIMTGNCLTTQGRVPEIDREMILDRGLEY
ncbi:MAG: hypothetical protein ABIM17_04655 [candidate division WOR-3 bacterium]